MQGKLTYEGIEQAVSEAVDFLTKAKIERKDITRARLNLEESLLRFRDRFGEDREFSMQCGKRLRKLRIIVQVAGESFDPFAPSEEDETSSALMRNAMVSMGELPVWQFSRGTNKIAFVFGKEAHSDWKNLVVSIVAAIVVGTALGFAPENVRLFIRDELFGPLLDTFMNALSAIAGPMIFVAIVWGIYSIGDASTFSSIGKRLIGRFTLAITVFTVVIGLATLTFFSFQWGDSGQFEFGPLFQMVLDVVPPDILSPFLEGNSLQILFLAICVGLAMLFIGEKTETVAIFAEQLNYIVQMIMGVISKLVPIYIFGTVLNMILSNNLDAVLGSLKLLGLNIGACLIIFFVSILIVVVKERVNFGVFLKKMLPTTLIGLTTASSAAAFGTNLKTCEQDYGMAEKLASFSVPFSQVIYKPSVGVLYFLAGVCIAELYGVPVNPMWFVSCFFMAVVFSIATPSIPGGTLASYTVLFTQLNIPLEGIAIVVALDILLDFVETATDLSSGQCMSILAADKFGLLDKDVLRKPAE